jgi:hypothetical protein
VCVEVNGINFSPINWREGQFGSDDGKSWL